MRDERKTERYEAQGEEPADVLDTADIPPVGLDQRAEEEHAPVGEDDQRQQPAKAREVDELRYLEARKVKVDHKEEQRDQHDGGRDDPIDVPVLNAKGHLAEKVQGANRQVPKKLHALDDSLQHEDELEERRRVADPECHEREDQHAELDDEADDKGYILEGIVAALRLVDRLCADDQRLVFDALHRGRAYSQTWR